MVDGISRIYSNQIQPTKPAKSSEKKSSAPANGEERLSQLVPDLKDKVEISAEGREAARAHAVGSDFELPAGDLDAVTRNWYSVGYRMAVEQS